MADGWNRRLTPQGTVHMVKKQDKTLSCGIACVAMVNYRMKKGYIGRNAAIGTIAEIGLPVIGALIGLELTREAINQALKSEAEVMAVYSQVTNRAYDGATVTTDIDKLPEVLRRLDCGLWECKNVRARDVGRPVAEAVSRGAPVIAAVQWVKGFDPEGKAVLGDTHAVVVDSVSVANRDTLFVCDPGDGDVHPTAILPEAVVYRDAGFFNGLYVCRRS